MEIISKNLEELSIVARKCIDYFSDNRIILFYGEMGAGKTTLIKEICRQYEVIDNVTSPTFSIVNEYHTKTHGIIYHFDFYRIKNEDEALDMGYEEYLFSGNRCLIEWPEKISNLLPADSVKVELKLKDSERHISLTK